MSVIDASTSRQDAPAAARGAGSRALGRLTRADVVMACLIAASIFGLYYRWFVKQFGPRGYSATQFEDWGHAYFVPVVAGFFIWKNRDKLAKLEARVYWPAVTLLPFAVVTYLYFILVFSNHMFQGAALVMTIAAAVLLIAGPVVLRALAFPIGYLLFAVTISEAVMNAITWQLKIVASKGSHIMLNMVGVETEIEGNILRIYKGTEVFPLNVADACSGMRMVIAFVALGTAVAFIASTEWWKRIAIMLVTLPVAIFMNIVRVTVLGVLTLFDPDLADGEAHTLIGTLLLVPAFLLFLGIVAIFDKLIVSDDEPAKKKPGKGKPKGTRPAKGTA